MAKISVSTVITAFNPSDSICDLVATALDQSEHVVIVDNSPGPVSRTIQSLAEMSNVQLIRTGANLGLAGALNIGSASAISSEFVFFLDQDSRLQAGTVEKLHSVAEACPEAAIVSPAPWDEDAQKFVDPRTTKRRDISEMDAVITSGMMLRTAALQTSEGFREDFFVDCVDQDLCLQLREKGWKILQDKRILLPHSLGETRWHGKADSTWIRSTSHPTWRLYWMARNGMTLSREYLTRLPGWALMNILLMLYVSMTVLLFEPPRWQRWGVFMSGIGDGLIGRRNSKYLPSGAVDVHRESPPARMGGVKRIAISTLIAGVLGYVITTVIARALGAEYAEFAVYWSGLYLVIGALSGIQQEYARGLPQSTESNPSSVQGARATWIVAVGLLSVIPLVAVGLIASSTQLFESNAGTLSWALGVGVVFQTALFAVTGFAFARHRWTALAAVIIGEIALRFALVVAVAIIAPTIVNFAWASVIPFPTVLLAVMLNGPLRRSFFAARFDATSTRILGHIGQAVLATAGSAALTNGVPLVIATTGRSESQSLVSTVILALILTRGPVVVGVFAFQSYLVVYFRRLSARVGPAILRIGFALTAASGLLAVAAALFGPQLLLFFAGPSYQISAQFIALLTLTSLSTGLLAVTGSAALGRSRHTIFVTGWLIGAVGTIAMLFLPFGLETRVLLALGFGPLFGVLIHLIGLNRRSRSSTIGVAQQATTSAIGKDQ